MNLSQILSHINNNNFLKDNEGIKTKPVTENQEPILLGWKQFLNTSVYQYL